jgi:hypothetical protein
MMPSRTAIRGAIVKFHAPAPIPDRLETLDGTEQLIVWCLRRWIVGHCLSQPANCEMVWNELAAGFGAACARQGLCALTRLVCAFGSHARRPIRYHQPCCGNLTADEFHVATLVAALGSGELLRAKGLAEWLVVSDGVADVLAAAGQLAAAVKGAVGPRHEAPTNPLVDREHVTTH